MLPDIGNRGVMRPAVRTGFGGLNHNLSAGDGEIYYMENLSSREYPLLATSGPCAYAPVRKINNGIGSYKGELFWVYEDKFYYGESSQAPKGTVEDSRKVFACMGDNILIFPDKMYYNVRTGTFGSLESRVFTTGVQFKNGTYAGVSAAANTIYVPGSEGKFSPGDAVTIVGCTLVPENNMTVVVREVEGNELRFYENTFTLYQDADYTEPEYVGVARTVPDLDYVCVNENRLWGCKYDTIYASALGDPFNFNVFDGLSTDSWSSQTQGSGDFTGCVSYEGYPIFFKEDAIIKVQGDQPSNFRWTMSSRFGVKAGCYRSLAVAGETLFYLSPAGVCAYTGGSPRVISDALGRNTSWGAGVAGSDGIRYYISMNTTDLGNEYRNGSFIYVYDTRYGEWYAQRLDNCSALCFAYHNDYQYVVTSQWQGEFPHMVGGTAYVMNPRDNDGLERVYSAYVYSVVKFADSTRFYETTDTGSQDKKGPLRLLFRASLGANAYIRVYVEYDSDGTWHDIGVLCGDVTYQYDDDEEDPMIIGTLIAAVNKKTFIVPLIPQRCDHYRIILEGSGQYIIYSMTEVKYHGSELQGINAKPSSVLQ